MPGENASVCHGIVRDEGVQVKMHQPGPVAVPLVRDAAGEIFEDAEFEIDSRIERPPWTPEEPTLPVVILLADCSNIRIFRRMPARAVEVPALANGDHLAEFAAPHDIADLLLVWIAQPL